MRRLLKWLDQYGLLILAGFLVAFIPLFPKIPLANAIPGYLVRIRLEDVLVLVAAGWWLIQVIRGKLRWQNLVVLGFMGFVVVSLLSLISAIVLLGWIPVESIHLAKSGLIFLRHIEYFTLFLIVFSAVRSRRDIKIVLTVVALTIVAATIYGFGQKHLGWPLFSTMNREFSKGVALQLSEHARVQSTFAGPYDLSAFLVITLPLLTGLPLLLGIALKLKSKLVQAGLAIVHLAGLWLMAVGASKSAVVAYGLAMVVVILLSAGRSHRRRWLSWVAAGGVVVSVLVTLTAMVVLFGGDASQRIVTIVGNHPVAQHVLPASLLARVQTAGDRPQDVYQEVPDIVEVATVSATGEPTTKLVERERVYSQNALKYGLSAGIRLDELWPRAIQGLIRDPFLGSGFGTLNKDGPVHFTEADSTDNNYLRILGETGLLGLITFFGTVGLALRYAWKNRLSSDPLIAGLSIGFIGAGVGLLANALYIDVFVASKVAFTFWAMSGLVAAAHFLEHPRTARRETRRWWQGLFGWLSRHWPLVVVGLLWIVVTHAVPLSQRGVITNLGASPDLTAHLSSGRCWLDQGVWSQCRAGVAQAAQVLSGTQEIQVAQGEGPEGLAAPSPVYTSWLLPFLALTFPQGYYYANLVLAAVSLGLMYALTQRLLSGRWQRFLALLIFVGALGALQLVAIPSAENLRLVLLLLAGYLWASSRFMLKSGWRRTVWWLILGLAVVTRFELDTTSLGLVVPWLAVGTAASVPALASSLQVAVATKAPAVFRRWVWKPATAVVVSGVVLAVAVTITPGPQIWNHLTASYQPDRELWQKAMIDEVFSNVMAVKPDGRPILITTLNPFFVDMYAQDSPELLPLSPQQTHFDEASRVWGEAEYGHLPNLYQQRLSEQRAVVVSDYNHNQLSRPPEFKNLTQSFGMELLTLGCDLRCNAYRLFKAQPYQPSPASTLNSPAVDSQSLASRPDGYSFLVYSHRFTPPPPGERNNTIVFSRKLLELNKHTPDFVMLMGDPVHIADDSQVAALFQFIEPGVSYPIVYSPGNYDVVEKKVFGPAFQSFRIGSAAFLVLNGGPAGEMGKEQTRFAVNQALQTAADDTVETVFVFLHRLSWLSRDEELGSLVDATNQGHVTDGDAIIQHQVLSRLEELDNKPVYVFSGDLRPSSDPDAEPSVLKYAPEGSNTMYLASAVNSRPGDVFFKVNVTADGVEVLPVSREGYELGQLDRYDLGYWRQQLGEPDAADQLALTTLLPEPRALMPLLGVFVVWSGGWWLVRLGWFDKIATAVRQVILDGI